MAYLRCRYIIDPSFQGEKYRCKHPSNKNGICRGSNCQHRENGRGCPIANTLMESNIKHIHDGKVRHCGFDEACTNRKDMYECSEEGVREWSERFLAPF